VTALRFIDAAEIAAALPPVAAVDALEAALRGGLDPEADPPRTAIETPAGQLLLMPSGAGAKLVTVVNEGQPRIKGVYVLFDEETLAPAAILDGIGLTDVRTAAVSALAARHLAPEARRLVVYGKGPQARAHIQTLKAVLPIEHVEVAGRGDDPDIEHADLIACCTTAREPLFDGRRVAGHATVIAIGSHEPEARETDDAIALRATVVVESRASAMREAGDVILAGLEPGDLTTLSEIVRGSEVLDGPRLFKSTGMSWEDAVIARAVYERVV
jgi:ornithine cyclodeaminase/alanine dehydrogenase-like protein (mu-crystallin family)